MIFKLFQLNKINKKNDNRYSSSVVSYYSEQYVTISKMKKNDSIYQITFQINLYVYSYSFEKSLFHFFESGLRLFPQLTT